MSKETKTLSTVSGSVHSTGGASSGGSQGASCAQCGTVGCELPNGDDWKTWSSDELYRFAVHNWLIDRSTAKRFVSAKVDGLQLQGRYETMRDIARKLGGLRWAGYLIAGAHGLRGHRLYRPGGPENDDVPRENKHGIPPFDFPETTWREVPLPRIGLTLYDEILCHSLNAIIKVDDDAEECERLFRDVDLRIHHIDINRFLYDGETPLQTAVRLKRINIVKLLIKYGAETYIYTKESPYKTALHIAAKARDTNMCKLLVQNGAVPNACDQSGKKPEQVSGDDGTCRDYLRYTAPKDYTKFIRERRDKWLARQQKLGDAFKAQDKVLQARLRERKLAVQGKIAQLEDRLKCVSISGVPGAMFHEGRTDLVALATDTFVVTQTSLLEFTCQPHGDPQQPECVLFRRRLALLDVTDALYSAKIPEALDDSQMCVPEMDAYLHHCAAVKQFCLQLNMNDVKRHDGSSLPVSSAVQPSRRLSADEGIAGMLTDSSPEAALKSECVPIDTANVTSDIASDDANLPSSVHLNKLIDTRTHHLQRASLALKRVSQEHQHYGTLIEEASKTLDRMRQHYRPVRNAPRGFDDTDSKLHVLRLEDTMAQVTDCVSAYSEADRKMFRERKKFQMFIIENGSMPKKSSRRYRSIEKKHRAALAALVNVCNDAMALIKENRNILKRKCTGLQAQFNSLLDKHLRTLDSTKKKYSQRSELLADYTKTVETRLEQQSRLHESFTVPALQQYCDVKQKLVDVRNSLELQNTILSVLRKQGRPDADRVKRIQELKQSYMTLAATPHYVQFRRLARSLLFSFPEVRMLMPDLHPAINAEVPLVGFDDVKVDERKSVLGGRHRVLCAKLSDGCAYTNLELGTPLALKQYSNTGSGSLQRLVKLLSRISHPNIMRLLCVVEHHTKLGDLEVYLGYPWLAGGSLRAWLAVQRRTLWGLRERPELTEEERREAKVISVLRPALNGLAYFHLNGLVHNDVKPENILIDGEGCAVIADLDGLQAAGSVIASTTTGSGAPSGSPTTSDSSTVTPVDSGSDSDSGLQSDIERPFTLSMATTDARTSQIQTEFGTAGYRDRFRALWSRGTPASDVFSVGVLFAELLLDYKPTGESNAYTNLQSVLQKHRARGPRVAEVCTLISSMVQQNPILRPRISKILEHPLLVGRPMYRKCFLCWETGIVVEKGITCANHHFACDVCVQTQVENYACRADIENWNEPRFAELEGKVVCNVQGCGHAYADSVVLDHLSDKARVWPMLVKTRQFVRDSQIAFKVQREQKTIFDRQLAEFKAMTEEERAIQTHRTHIISEFLNLKCPRCRSVFVDFSGCFAVACSKCKCSFCAWCLKDCGDNAHPHVKECSKSLKAGSYYGSEEMFIATHKERRIKQISEYMSHLESKLASKVAASSINDWKDLDLTVLVQKYIA